MTTQEKLARLKKLVKECGNYGKAAERLGVSKSLLHAVCSGAAPFGRKLCDAMDLPYSHEESGFYRKQCRDKERVYKSLVKLWTRQRVAIRTTEISLRARVLPSTARVLLARLEEEGRAERVRVQAGYRWLPQSADECVLCGCPK